MDKFLGEKNILGVSELVEKTPQGYDMVSVNFEDGTKETMPKKRFEFLVTDTVSDATTVQGKIKSGLATLVLGMFNEYGVKMGETELIFGAAAGLVNDGFTKAQDLMWGVDYQGISLIEVNNVLKKNYDKEHNNGAGSGGSGTDPENTN